MPNNHIIRKIGCSVFYIWIIFITVFSPLSLSYAPSTVDVEMTINTAQAVGLTPDDTTGATPITAGPKKTLQEPTSCGGFASVLIAPVVCGVRWTLTMVASVLLQAGAGILSISSGLFSMLVEKTIISFGDTGGTAGTDDGLLSDSAIQAINKSWTVFRDISNIVIIGLFTFIAINIILGSSEFGQKKLIARVLLVAILINFSLLFTKIIIDFSNYTATQFYYAGIGAQVPQAAGSGGSTGSAPAGGGSSASAQKTPDGIGDQFLRSMGITSFAQTKDALDRIGTTQDSAASILYYAIVMFAILIAAAFVLFYGSFILASRAVLLVFLMITAALAFASHLLPDSYTNGKFGWGMWWRSLIHSAVLAPILMVMLAVTLAVAKTLQVQSASLGDITFHSTKSANIESLLSYLIILGLLLATFKLASSFSTGISGFNWASAALAMPLAGGVRLMGAVTGRTGLAASMALSGAAGRIKSESKMAQLGRGALYGGAAGAAALATGSRGGGGVLGGVLANQVKGTGLNQRNMLPGRTALPGAAAAHDTASASAAAAIKAALSRTAGSKEPAKAVVPAQPAPVAKPSTPPTPATAVALPAGGTPKPATPQPRITAQPPKQLPGPQTNKEAEKIARTEVTTAAVTAMNQANEAAEKRLTDQKAAENKSAQDANDLKQEIKEAVGAGGANDNTAKALAEQGKQNTATIEKMQDAVKESQEKATQELGVEMKTATAGMKEAATKSGAALTEGVKGVQEMAKRAVDLQTKSTEIKKDDKLAREVGAAEEHAKSVRKGEDRAAAENIAAAGAQALAITRAARLNEIRGLNQATNDNHANDNTPSIPLSSSVIPTNPNSSIGARLAAQPYTQASTQSHTGPTEIPLHQGALDAEALLKQVRETRTRLRDQLSQGNNTAPAQGSNPPHLNIPPTAS